MAMRNKQNEINSLVSDALQKHHRDYFMVDSPSVMFGLDLKQQSAPKNLFQFRQSFRQTSAISRHQAQTPNERAYYSAIKQILAQLLKSICQNITNRQFALREFFQYEQIVLYNFFQGFTEQIKSECREKGEFLQFVWTSQMKLMHYILEHFQKNQHHEEKSKINEMNKIHQNYLSLLEKQTLKVNDQNSYIDSLKEIIKVLVEKIRFRRKQAKTLLKETQLLIKIANDFKDRNVELELKYLSLMQTTDQFSEKQLEELQNKKKMLGKICKQVFTIEQSLYKNILQEISLEGPLETEQFIKEAFSVLSNPVLSNEEAKAEIDTLFQKVQEDFEDLYNKYEIKAKSKFGELQKKIAEVQAINVEEGVKELKKFVKKQSHLTQTYYSDKLNNDAIKNVGVMVEVIGKKNNTRNKEVQCRIVEDIYTEKRKKLAICHEVARKLKGNGSFSMESANAAKNESLLKQKANMLIKVQGKQRFPSIKITDKRKSKDSSDHGSKSQEKIQLSSSQNKQRYFTEQNIKISSFSDHSISKSKQQTLSKDSSSKKLQHHKSRFSNYHSKPKKISQSSRKQSSYRGETNQNDIQRTNVTSFEAEQLANQRRSLTSIQEVLDFENNLTGQKKLQPTLKRASKLENVATSSTKSRNSRNSKLSEIPASIINQVLLKKPENNEKKLTKKRNLSEFNGTFRKVEKVGVRKISMRPLQTLKKDEPQIKIIEPAQNQTSTASPAAPQNKRKLLYKKSSKLTSKVSFADVIVENENEKDQIQKDYYIIDHLNFNIGNQRPMTSLNPLPAPKRLNKINKLLMFDEIQLKLRKSQQIRIQGSESIKNKVEVIIQNFWLRSNQVRLKLKKIKNPIKHSYLYNTISSVYTRAYNRIQTEKTFSTLLEPLFETMLVLYGKMQKPEMQKKVINFLAQASSEMNDHICKSFMYFLGLDEQDPTSEQVTSLDNYFYLRLIHKLNYSGSPFADIRTSVTTLAKIEAELPSFLESQYFPKEWSSEIASTIGQYFERSHDDNIRLNLFYCCQLIVKIIISRLLQLNSCFKPLLDKLSELGREIKLEALQFLIRSVCTTEVEELKSVKRIRFLNKNNKISVNTNQALLLLARKNIYSLDHLLAKVKSKYHTGSNSALGLTKNVQKQDSQQKMQQIVKLDQVDIEARDILEHILGPELSSLFDASIQVLSHC